MLAADQRLRDSLAFRRTVRSGRRAGGRALVVHLATRSDAPSAAPPDAPSPGHGSAPVRVGLVVSKAVGNAVVRNRVKRRLRHVAREVVGDLRPGSDLVVRALPPAAGLSSAELRVELGRCLERADRAERRPAAASRGRTGAAS